ncbi:hypothetical protein [Paenibacillus sp. OV219]|uniref:hypothetical protein n=1 Tax=Paenibacillus sp. OV219 TaxID=1884377 RepID=UPI0008C7F214|nr:hypothetical protein [Paenibacillus sp. OV219]SEM81143.1 hypothetical protein SAMN05518847_101865 [Paenibacillus sp. OV219]
MVDKILAGIEKYSVRVIVIVVLCGLTLNYLASLYFTNYFVDGINKALLGPISDNLVKKEGVLTTIAAVFTGIYFTVFTLFGSLKLESTFAHISKNNFFRLVGFLNRAFVGAFIYLFATIAISFLIDADKGMNIPHVIILLVLLLYMMLSAFRFGLFCYLIFKRDLGKLHELLNAVEADKREVDNVMQRMKLFLDDYDNERNSERTVQMKEFIKNRKKEQ